MFRYFLLTVLGVAFLGWLLSFALHDAALGGMSIVVFLAALFCLACRRALLWIVRE